MAPVLEPMLTVELPRHGKFQACMRSVEALKGTRALELARSIAGQYKAMRSPVKDYMTVTYWLCYPRVVLAVVYLDMYGFGPECLEGPAPSMKAGSTLLEAAFLHPREASNAS